LSKICELLVNNSLGCSAIETSIVVISLELPTSCQNKRYRVERVGSVV